MCICTPGIKTPYCGRPGCTWPESDDEPITQQNVNKPVCLGNIVEDIVTGLRGTACAILEPMTGMKQIGIQPKGDGSVIPESTFVDAYLVEVKEEGLANRLPLVAVQPFEFGQEVREISSGQIGVVTSKLTYLNGCIHLGITTASQKNKNPEVFFIDHQRLQLVSEGVKDKIPASSDSGGPNLKMSSIKTR